MQQIGKREVAYVCKTVCDRCGFEELSDQPSSFEMTAISFVAGYGSKFGDGSSVAIDLCETCLRETLGPWLRIVERRDDRMESKLLQFDSLTHGGEFPLKK